MASSQINHRFLHITKKTSNDTAFLISGRGTLTHKQNAKRTFGCFEVEPRELYMGDMARMTSMFNPPKQFITLCNRSLLPCSVDMVPNKNQRVRAAFKAGNEYNKRKVAPGMTISIEVSVNAPGAKKRRNHDGGIEDLRAEPIGYTEDQAAIIKDEKAFNDNDYEAYLKPELLDTICIRAGRQVFAVPVYAGSAPINIHQLVEQKEDLLGNVEEEDRPETAALNSKSSNGALATHQLPHMHGTFYNSDTHKLEWRSDRVQYQLHPELEFSQAIRKEEDRHHQHSATQFPRHLLDVQRARSQVAVTAPAKTESLFTKHQKKKKVVRIHPDVVRVLELKEEREQARREEQVMMGIVAVKEPKKKTRRGSGGRPLAPVRSSRNAFV